MNTLSEIFTALFNRLREISEGINTIIAGAQANNELLKSLESRIIELEDAQNEMRSSLTMTISEIPEAEPNAAGVDGKGAEIEE